MGFWRAAGAAAALGATLAAAASGVACRRTEALKAPRPRLRIATAFAPLSQPLTAEYRKRLPDVDIESEAAGDAEAVIAGVERGTVDVAIALADDAYFAYAQGMSDRNQGSTSRLRAIALLLPLPQYVVVRPNAGIKSIADLRGRRVALGSATSSSAKLGQLVLDAFGVRATVSHVTSRDEAAMALRDGSIDAAFFPGYVYPDRLTYAAIRAGAYFIPIAGPPIERLRREHPFVRLATIPRGIYPGQDRIIPTVGLDMVVLCRRDLDASLVHDLTARLFDAFPRLTSVEATLRYLNPDEAPATPIPLHPGAARYFREREWSR